MNCCITTRKKIKRENSIGEMNSTLHYGIFSGLVCPGHPSSSPALSFPFPPPSILQVAVEHDMLPVCSGSALLRISSLQPKDVSKLCYSDYI